jgi:hypothetical protein
MTDGKLNMDGILEIDIVSVQNFLHLIIALCLC